MSSEGVSEASPDLPVERIQYEDVVRQADNPSSYLTSQRKRALDIVFALVGLMITLVLLVPVSLIMVLTSGFPVFYRRDRLGLYGRKFVMVKFTTMKTGSASDTNDLRTAINDPRISMIGRIIRKTYVDELPQFWNVLMGEMSVVGPRPEFPELAIELNQIRRQFPKRLLAKPGVTGLAQVRYTYSHDNAHAVGRLP